MAEPVTEYLNPTKDGAVLQMGEQAVAAGRARELNIAVDRIAVVVGLAASCRLDVRTATGNTLEVTLEQLVYRKTFTGEGSLSTSNIPVAPVGTAGKLTARDVTTGEVFEQSWHWVPAKSGGAAGKSRLAALGRRLMQRQVRSETAKADKPSLGERAHVSTLTGIGFFDIRVHDGRIAFVLDISGSMAGTRIAICRQQLTNALEQLSESAEFVVVLFSHKLVEPPMQSGWLPARKETVQRVVQWMNGVQVGGGTEPWPAFERVFSFASKPDAIYFLTDGDVSGIKPEALERLRAAQPRSVLRRVLATLFSDKSGKASAVINTIAVDAPASESILKQIASDSGGEYRSFQSSD